MLLPNDPYRNTVCAVPGGLGQGTLSPSFCPTAPSRGLPQSLLLYAEALPCVVRLLCPGRSVCQHRNSEQLGQLWVQHEAGSQEAAAEQKWKQYGGRGRSRAGA